MNRLLLRGAAHHDRDNVFLHWGGAAWVSTPDWRADRHSIRIALALRERHGVGPGDSVAISMSLCLEWALVERAVWGLGATSVFATADAVLTVDGPLASELLELGGVLDTPERATRFRALARDTPPETIASIEGGRERTHAAWVGAIERFRERYPPAPGTTHHLVSEAPDMPSRVALYAGWSDGLTSTALGPCPSGIESATFVRLSHHG